MNFSTPVELPKGLPPITHAQQLLLMGSCFAENIGRQLKENSFHCDVNPFGILYNPFLYWKHCKRFFRESNIQHPIFSSFVIVGIVRCITGLFSSFG